MIGSMPNRDRFRCQTMIDSDAILQLTPFELAPYCHCIHNTGHTADNDKRTQHC